MKRAVLVIVSLVISLFAGSCAPRVGQFDMKIETETAVIDIKGPLFRVPDIDSRIESFVNDHISEFEKNPPPAKDDPRKYKNELFITYDDAFVSDKYISVLLTVMTYTGGAHPTTLLYAKAYDKKAGKELAAKDLVADPEALKPRIIEQLQKKIKEGDQTWIRDGVMGSDLNNFTIGRDSITFHFSPYEVACYADGPQSASFRLSSF